MEGWLRDPRADLDGDVVEFRVAVPLAEDGLEDGSIDERELPDQRLFLLVLGDGRRRRRRSGGGGGSRGDEVDEDSQRHLRGVLCSKLIVPL